MNFTTGTIYYLDDLDFLHELVCPEGNVVDLCVGILFGAYCSLFHFLRLSVQVRFRQIVGH